MSESNEPQKDAERDLAEHERPQGTKPEIGLVSDEQLPEDVRPTEDNPLAKNPGDEDDDSETGMSGPKVEGMPDAGSPGAPT